MVHVSSVTGKAGITNWHIEKLAVQFSYAFFIALAVCGGEQLCG